MPQAAEDSESSTKTEKWPWWTSRLLMAISALIAVGYFVVYAMTVPSVALSNLGPGRLWGKIFGSVLGGLFWGAVVWAPFRFSRGKEKAPSLVVFMAVAMTLVGVAQISKTAVVNRQLYAEPRIALRSQFFSQCAADMSKMPESKLPANLHTEPFFCKCFAEAVVKSLTETQVLPLIPSGEAPSDMASKRKNAVRQCAQTH